MDQALGDVVVRDFELAYDARAGVTYRSRLSLAHNAAHDHL
jgi:hypothetical protein